MYIKQVRSRDNRYSTVQYDKDGNIILQTKAAIKARNKAKEAVRLKKQQLKCTALTKKKRPCPNFVENWRNGTLCHVHDPNGKFRQQVKAKREFYLEQEKR